MMRLLLALLLAVPLAAHAQLTKVSTGSSFDNGGSTWNTTNLTKDTGTASGDLGIISLAWYENINDNDITPVTDFVDQGSTPYAGSGLTETRAEVYTRAMSGSDAATFAVTRSSGSAMFAMTQLLTLRGDSALSIVSVTAGTPVSGATSVTCPSATITATQAIVCAYFLSDPGGTYTPPSGMTLGVADASENTNPVRTYFESPSAGVTGTRTLSWTTSRDALGVMIVVEGANSGGGGGGSAVPAILQQHY